MMITEMLGRVPNAARLARGRRLPLGLTPLVGKGRFAGHLETTPGGGSRAIDADQRRSAAAAGRSAAPSNGPLTCLTGGSLAKRFHAWSGNSGRRYICSVFPVKAEEAEAAMPDFAGAIVIAVGIDADLRRPIAFYESRGEVSETCDLRRKFLDAALAASVREWHVHLLATDPVDRQLVKMDLESAWLDANVGQERPSQQS